MNFANHIDWGRVHKVWQFQFNKIRHKNEVLLKEIYDIKRSEKQKQAKKSSKNQQKSER